MYIAMNRFRIALGRKRTSRICGGAASPTSMAPPASVPSTSCVGRRPRSAPSSHPTPPGRRRRPSRPGPAPTPSGAPTPTRRLPPAPTSGTRSSRGSRSWS